MQYQEVEQPQAVESRGLENLPLSHSSSTGKKHLGLCFYICVVVINCWFGLVVWVYSLFAVVSLPLPLLVSCKLAFVYKFCVHCLQEVYVCYL